ncbi:hypothetical protein FSP39_010949 [Pinctada imbricata]|uniref:Uncharacterized protein n=1 Tax=Pinctada imbricata TaxID=66713 RepID=A0AA88YQR6_PINIB|nr:hypothetical protein FSP39_010949 [Pinctada imbricata]
MNQKSHSGPDIIGKQLGNPKIQFSSRYTGMELQSDESGSDSDDGDNGDDMILTEGNRGLQRSFNATTFVILPILAVLSVICLVLLIYYLARHHRRKKVVDEDETSPDYRDFSTNNSTIPLTRLNPENIVYYDIDGPPEIINSTVPSPLNQDGGIYHEIDHLQVALHDSKQEQKINHDANGNNIQKENEYFKLEAPSKAHSYSNLSKDKNSECYELAKPLSQITNDESMLAPEYFKLEATKRHEYQNEPTLKTDVSEIIIGSEIDKEKPGGNEYFTLEKCVQNEAKGDATAMETDSITIASTADNQYFTLEISSSDEAKNGSPSLGKETEEDAAVMETASKANVVHVSRADNEYFTLEMVGADDIEQNQSSASQKDNEYFVLESINEA